MMNGVCGRQVPVENGGMLMTQHLPSDAKQQLVQIRYGDYLMIKKKIASYETRLKGFANLQKVLHQRDLELAQVKQEAMKYRQMCEVLHRQIQQQQQQQAAGVNVEQNAQLQQQIRQQQQETLHLKQQQHSPQQFQSPQVSPQRPSPQYQTVSPQQQTASPQQHQVPSPAQYPVPSPQNYIVASPQQRSTGSPQQYQMQHSPPQQVPVQNSQPAQLQAQVTRVQPQHEQLQQTLPGITHILPPPTTTKQPVMHTDDCSDPDYLTFSGTDLASLERILMETTNEFNNMPIEGAMAPRGFPLQPNLSHRDLEMDGEEDVSLNSLLSHAESLKGIKVIEGKVNVPDLPTMSQKIFKEVVANNIRLQKELKEVSAVKGSNKSKVEYEQIIHGLRNQLKQAEQRYKVIKATTDSILSGDRNVVDILRSYQETITQLKHIVVLKQSLQDVFKQEAKKASDSVKDESAQTTEIESLTESFSQTSITNDNDPDVKEAEIMRLSNEMAKHQEELQMLQSEVQKQMSTLKETQQLTDTEKERLRRTENQVQVKQRECIRLASQCKEHQDKLKTLKEESQKEEHKNDEEKNVILAQLEAYEEDYNNLQKDLECSLQELKKAKAEVEKLRTLNAQQKQLLESYLTQQRHRHSQVGPVVREPWMSPVTQLPFVVAHDGPTSLSMQSLMSSSGVSSGVSSRPDSSASSNSSTDQLGKTTQFQCDRCLRNFDNEEYFRDHINKCTDT